MRRSRSALLLRMSWQFLIVLIMIQGNIERHQQVFLSKRLYNKTIRMGGLRGIQHLAVTVGRYIDKWNVALVQRLGKMDSRQFALQINIYYDKERSLLIYILQGLIDRVGNTDDLISPILQRRAKMLTYDRLVFHYQYTLFHNCGVA